MLRGSFSLFKRALAYFEAGEPMNSRYTACSVSAAASGASKGAGLNMTWAIRSAAWLSGSSVDHFRNEAADKK